MISVSFASLFAGPCLLQLPLLGIELLDEALHVADELWQVLFAADVADAIGWHNSHLLEHHYIVLLPGEFVVAKVLGE